MKPTAFLIFLILLLICSCKKSTEKGVDIAETYTWNLSQDKDTPFDKLKYEYVIFKGEPLGKLIGTIKKMVIHNDNIFVQSGNRLNVYNQTGDYIRSIGEQGRARNEYLYLEDFSIYNNMIYILDGRGSAVLSYDINGDFLENKKTPISSFGGILALRNSFVFYRPCYDLEDFDELFKYAITITDLELNIIKQEIEYNETSPKITNGSPFIENGDKAFFNRFFTYTFSQINRSDSTIVTYAIDCLSEQISPEVNRNYDLIFSEKGDKRFIKSVPIIFKNWLFGRTTKNRESKSFMINLDTKKVYEDNEYLNVYPSGIGFNDNYLFIPYEYSKQNKNDIHLPDSIRIASEDGTNVIIKVDLGD